MKTFFGLIVLGWAAIGAVAGGVYLLYLAAGSWERLGLWGLYLLVGLVFSLVSALIGANIWYTEFMNPVDPYRDYRRFGPWLDERRAAREQKVKAKQAALKQDGQLSETQAGAGQVALVERNGVVV